MAALVLSPNPEFPAIIIELQVQGKGNNLLYDIFFYLALFDLGYLWIKLWPLTVYYYLFNNIIYLCTASVIFLY